MAAIPHNSASTAPENGPDRATAYSWIVFALSFGLLISDYMARQVLNAVFPLLKAEWHVTDAQLGLLSGIVALMVGLLTFPLSLAADRWGRVKSLTLMAVLWSVATIMCAMARSYPEMLIGRMLVGVGEAAYGSVGIAVVISVFPSRMRATLSAAFMAGGLMGQVLGVALGGIVAASHGWRTAFMLIGVGGLIIALLYPLVVKEGRIAQLTQVDKDDASKSLHLGDLFKGRTVKLTYLASGLQLYAAGALPAWLPTYFTRSYALSLADAGKLAAFYLLICGTGMIVCGAISDRMARQEPENKIRLAIFFSLGSAAALLTAFLLPPGPLQLVMLGVAMFLVAGTTGPAGAMVANLTPLAIHGTAFATLTLANNLIGLAPGPIITGRIADAIGLSGALCTLPITCVAAAIIFALARSHYLTDMDQRKAVSPQP